MIRMIGHELWQFGKHKNMPNIALPFISIRPVVRADGPVPFCIWIVSVVVVVMVQQRAKIALMKAMPWRGKNKKQSVRPVPPDCAPCLIRPFIHLYTYLTMVQGVILRIAAPVGAPQKG